MQLAPGLGVTVSARIGAPAKTAVRIAGNLDRIRRLVARAVGQVCNMNEGEPLSPDDSEDVDALAEALSRFCTTSPDCARDNVPHPERATKRIDFGNVDLTTRRDREAIEPNWSEVEKALCTLGLTLSGRSSASEVTHVRKLDLLDVFEVSDASGKVLSEGKGRTTDAGKKSVLGEAIERLLAQRPQSRGILTTTATALTNVGYRLPNMYPTAFDLFSESLPMDWVSASSFDGEPSFLPAEIAFYPYEPRLGVRAFTVQHTAGLGAGRNLNEAVAAGLLEAIETDSYRISMRLRHIPYVIPTHELETLVDQSISQLISRLANESVAIHAGLISRDWPLPIVVVWLEDTGGRLPAMAHGLGSGTTIVDAFERAILEAVQVHTGLQKICAAYWPEIVDPRTAFLDGNMLSCSHAYRDRILRMYEIAPVLPSQQWPSSPCSRGSFEQILKFMRAKAYRAWYSELGQLHGITAVRVFIEGAISPRNDMQVDGARLCDALQRSRLPLLYLDPIPT